MRLKTNKTWSDLLRWLASRPLASAAVATILLAATGALIRPPVIEGSMVDQLSGSNHQLEISRRIRAAGGDTSTTAIIVTPTDVPIGAIFDDLAALRKDLQSLDVRIDLRSIDAAREQLFLYGLSTDDSVTRLLSVLRDNPQATAIINAAASRFLIVIRSPEALQQDTFDVISDHRWSGLYEDRRILASTQLENDIAAGLSKDLRRLIPVIVFVSLMALFLAFGHWRAMLLPVFACAASTIVTFALFSVLGVTINLVTLLALPIVLIVGLANSCHFLAKSSSASDLQGGIDRVVAVALQRVGPPFFFSSLTTAIALASLSFNDLAPIANLGRLSAIALLLVFPLIMLAAPLSLRWYLESSSRSLQESRAFVVLSRVLAKHRSRITAALLVATLVGAMTIPLLSVKTDPRAFFPDAAPFSSAIKLFEREFYLFSPLEVLVSVKDEHDDPLSVFQKAAVLRAALDNHTGTRQVTMAPAVEGNGAYVLSALLTGDNSLRQVFALLEEQRAAFGDGVEIIYSNASMVYRDIDRQAMVSLLRSLGWSVALIFGAILFVFRSPAAMLSAMLASAVPLTLVCGVVWIIGSPLNLVTAVVFLVALGVIVDDAIHILFWRAGGDRLTGSSIEFSVLLSTTMLCLGLALCQLSAFPTTRQFAAYCALALVGAVISNLSVLPFALRWSDAAGPSASSDVEIGDS
jgi:hypothetical protein